MSLPPKWRQNMPSLTRTSNSCRIGSSPSKAIDKDTAKRLLQTIYAAPHGVYAMSQDIPGLVETSTNLASVKMKPGHIIRIETKPAQLYRLLQTRHCQYGAYCIRNGWSSRIVRRRISGLEAQPIQKSWKWLLSPKTFVRCRCQGKSYPCRSGMRTVP